MAIKIVAKTLRILGYMLAGLIIIVLITLAIAPTVAKNYINKHGQDLIGRTIEIDKFKIKYLRGIVSLSNFKVYEQNNSDIFVGLDEFDLDLNLWKLRQKEIHVEKLNLTKLHGRVIQNDTVFNFSDLLKLGSTDTTKAEEAKAEEPKDTTKNDPFKLNLNNISLNISSLSYTDEKLDHTMAIEDFKIAIPQLYWAQQDSSELTLAFDLSNGGSLKGDVQYDVQNGGFSGWLNIKALALHTFLPYAKQQMHINDIEGTFSTHIDFSGNQHDLTQFYIKGSLQFDSLAILDTTNQKLIGLDKHQVIIKEAYPIQKKFEIELIQIDAPYVNFALMDSSTNMDQVMIVSADTAKLQTENVEQANDTSQIITGQMDSTEMNLTINKFKINNGVIDFYDHRLRDDFYYELSGLTVDMDTLGLNDDWVNISANMVLNQRGKLKAQIGMNPFNPMDKVQLNYVITDFQLTDLNIYSKHYAGLPILYGDMYYQGNTSINNNKMDSKNEIIIRNVEMGRKAGGLYDVPIKTALFILKDKNGDITLDVPVKGDLSDPNINAGKIIGETLKDFVVKVVASPFKAIGKASGMAQEDLEQIPFDYDEKELTKKQKRTINKLLEFKEEKPELTIELQYVNDYELERADAAKEIVRKMYTDEKSLASIPNLNDYLKWLEEKSNKEDLVIQDYELMLAPENRIQEVLKHREDQRIRIIQNYLIENGHGTKIKVLPYNPEEMYNHGSRPRMMVRYSVDEGEE